MTRTRDQIELDLPFHVNGTLTEAERAEVEGWLAEDELLRAELDALAAIRDEMQAGDIRSPGEFGLARLMRDVGRQGAGPVSLSQPAPDRTWMWQAAAAVAVVGLLGQALWLRGTGATDDGFQLASAELRGALVVSFAPGATEDAIRTLLVGQELEIVAGPSALGLYRLDAVEGGSIAVAADALRAAGDIVESVENAEN